MKRLDDMEIRIQEEELYSGLQERELLEAEPLSRREAERIFKQVCAKKEGKTGRSRKKTKRVVVILAAAVVTVFVLTAAAIQVLWPVLFEENDHYSAIVQGDWDEEKFEAYAAAGEMSGVQVSDNGVTVRLNRLYYCGNLTVADIDVITPYQGVTLGEADSRWMPGFERQDEEIAYRVLTANMASGDTFLKESDDPTDNTLSMWVFLATNDYDILGKEISFERGGVIFSNLNCLDGNGERVRIEGRWALPWKLDNKAGIRRSFSSPMIVNDLQRIESYRLTECTLGLRILLNVDPEDDYIPQVYSPVIKLKDGTVFDQDFPASTASTSFDIDGMKLKIFVTFPHPIDISQVESIQYGSVVIPVNE
ncbi:MAG: hypothetical protein HFJ85_01645 [Oscillospiraceae bacterium]|nr:hypothetical protein [Oscillospiraceae bacterium]